MSAPGPAALIIMNGRQDQAVSGKCDGMGPVTPEVKPVDNDIRPRAIPGDRFPADQDTSLAAVF